MGDMNVDLLKFESHNKTNDYLDNIFTRGCVPMITKPTRVTMSSASLIDHIYTNNVEYSCTSGIVITDLADHFGIFHCIDFFTDANISKFKSYLDQTDYRNILSTSCPNDHSMISSHYTKRLSNVHFPCD